MGNIIYCHKPEYWVGTYDNVTITPVQNHVISENNYPIEDIPIMGTIVEQKKQTLIEAYNAYKQNQNPYTGYDDRFTKSHSELLKIQKEHKENGTTYIPYSIIIFAIVWYIYR